MSYSFFTLSFTTQLKILILYN